MEWQHLYLGPSRVVTGGAIIPSKLRPRHHYIVGKPGKGKSTLMQRLILQDAKRPYATMVFDAGDLATDVLLSLPDKTYAERTAFFSVDYPIPYNPFLRRNDFAREPARLANELFALLDQVVSESATHMPLTPRMRRLLDVGIEEVLKQPNPSFATLATYLVEKKAALQVAFQLPKEEFNATWDGLIDRLSTLLRDGRIRRVLCAGHELDFNAIIDSGVVLLISLAGLEPTLKRILGTILFHGLQATMLERRRKDRRPAAIYIDEFHDYISSSEAVANFQTLFGEGRKYLAALCVAHTDFGQIPERLLKTIHGTAGCLTSFSCGTQESVAMAHSFGAEYLPQTVAFLADYEAITRVDTNVHSFKTYTAIPPRRVLEEDVPLEHHDPPNPLAVVVPTHADRDPYSQPRKPRRAARAEA